MDNMYPVISLNEVEAWDRTKLLADARIRGQIFARIDGHDWRALRLIVTSHPRNEARRGIRSR